MPTYSYTRGEQTIERYYPLGKAPTRVKHRGRMFERNPCADHRRFCNTPGAWPMASDAAGCHPDQIPEQAAVLRRKGVRAEFTKDGRVIFENPQHRKRVCEAMGLFDRNGGFSDPRRGLNHDDDPPPLDFGDF